MKRNLIPFSFLLGLSISAFSQKGEAVLKLQNAGWENTSIQSTPPAALIMSIENAKRLKEENSMPYFCLHMAW